MGLVFEPPGARRGTVLAWVGEPFEADGSRLEKSERRGAIATTTRRIESSLRGLLAGVAAANRALARIYAELGLPGLAQDAQQRVVAVNAERAG